MRYDPITWMQRYLRIETTDGRLLPLSCNLAQLKVHNSLESQRRAGFPQRAVILKARREGVSTYMEGRCFYEINVRSMRHACICSADLDASSKVFKMARLFQSNMPSGVCLPTDYSNRKEIVYSAPHSSSFMVQTAGKGVLGRGGLTHYLHLSEFAFWNNAKEQFGGAVQEVPDDVDTLVVLESTANGVGGAFYDMYMQAYEDYTKAGDLRNYLPIFLPWFIFPAYQTEAIGFKIGVAHSEGYEGEWCEDEYELVERYGLTSEQLMWRRWAIKNRCQGDLAMFRQEFPACPEEAFQSSGRPVFSHSLLNKQVIKSGNHILFGPEPVAVVKNYDVWTIYKGPESQYQYAIGIDTMVGRLSDTSDIRSDRDHHGVAVLNRDTKEVVAIYRGGCTQDELAEQCMLCARYYNNAYIAPELPNGMQVLVRFRESGYPNIFQRQQPEDREFVDDTESLGWKTTTTTRPLMVESFKSFLSEGVVLNSSELIREMREFIYDKTGKPMHRPGKHDDLLFGAMIALQVHLHSPFRAIPYSYGTTWDGCDIKPPLELAMAGAIDPGPCEMEDDELWITTE